MSVVSTRANYLHYVPFQKWTLAVSVAVLSLETGSGAAGKTREKNECRSHRPYRTCGEIRVANIALFPTHEFFVFSPLPY